MEYCVMQQSFDSVRMHVGYSNIIPMHQVNNGGSWLSNLKESSVNYIEGNIMHGIRGLALWAASSIIEPWKWGCCNIAYLYETRHTKLKFREISFFHNIGFSCSQSTVSLCIISKRFENWELTFGRTRFHMTSVYDEYRKLILHCKPPGPRLNIKTVFPSMGIPTLKIRWSRDRLIFNIGIPILVRRHLYIETAPWIP